MFVFCPKAAKILYAVNFSKQFYTELMGRKSIFFIGAYIQNDHKIFRGKYGKYGGMKQTYILSNGFVIVIITIY